MGEDHDKPVHEWRARVSEPTPQSHLPYVCIIVGDNIDKRIAPLPQVPIGVIPKMTEDMVQIMEEFIPQREARVNCHSRSQNVWVTV